MRALLISAKDRAITEVESNTLEDLQSYVGGYIDTAHVLANNDTIFVNDEGMIHWQSGNPSFQDWFFIEGAHQPFCGNGILVGSNDCGETTPALTSADDLRARVKFMSTADVVSQARAGAYE